MVRFGGVELGKARNNTQAKVKWRPVGCCSVRQGKESYSGFEWRGSFW